MIQPFLASWVGYHALDIHAVVFVGKTSAQKQYALISENAPLASQSLSKALHVAVAVAKVFEGNDAERPKTSSAIN
jgi:hypothetical protein